MKILLDPILTSSPASCSTLIQFYTFVKRVLFTEGRKDVFFYWTVPDFVTEEEFQWYPKHPNIEYIFIPQHKDRTKEYLTLTPEMDRLLAFNGSHWDFDVLLTVRSGLVPLYKLVMNSPRHTRMSWLKEVWLMEEMPLMAFKKTVAVMDKEVQDRFTIMGYLAADRVTIVSYHEKAAILQSARQFLTPSHVMALDKKIKEVCPSVFNEFSLKDPKYFFKPNGDRKFCIAYVGRMEKVSARLEDLNHLMTAKYAVKADNVRLLVCTVSKITKIFDESAVEVKHASREEFWQHAREDMHVGLMMHTEAGFTLSLLEPMMLGTPVILIREPWNEALLGKDYPFYAETKSQAYALLERFYQDYEGMYALYAVWQKEHFIPLFTHRFQNDLLYDVWCQYIDAFDPVERFRQEYPNKAYNSIALAIVDWVQDKTEFVLFEALREMGDAGVLASLDAKLKDDSRDEKGLVWATAWNEFRIILKAHYGWEDASTQVGHLKRSVLKGN